MQRLGDIEEIRQLCARYGFAWDDGNLALLLDIFASDGIFDQTLMGHPVAQGHAALTETFAAYSRIMAGGSFHAALNNVIDFDDADHAHGACYQIGEVHTSAGLIQVNSLWKDRYVRVGGAWKFQARVLHLRTPPRRIETFALDNVFASASGMIAR